MKVSDPQHRVWHVRRRWWPWRRRWRLPPLHVGDVPVAATRHVDGSPWELLLHLLLLLLLVPTLLLTALALAEAALLVLLLPIALLARIVGGRHWVVEVRNEEGPVWETDAGSWAASGVAVSEIAAGLARGERPWSRAAGGRWQGRRLSGARRRDRRTPGAPGRPRGRENVEPGR